MRMSAAYSSCGVPPRPPPNFDSSAQKSTPESVSGDPAEVLGPALRKVFERGRTSRDRDRGERELEELHGARAASHVRVREESRREREESNGGPDGSSNEDSNETGRIIWTRCPNKSARATEGADIDTSS